MYSSYNIKHVHIYVYIYFLENFYYKHYFPVTNVRTYVKKKRETDNKTHAQKKQVGYSNNIRIIL